jgi:predicted nucleotidyltransferase component of viral defense system
VRYQGSAAFRRALEDRLRAQSIASGVPLVRLRKMVAFDRFLARLIADQPDDWVLKGGLALQLRLGNRARTTKDIDLLLKDDQHVQDVHQALVRAALLDLRDWFQFEVARPASADLRFPVQGLLDGRAFETFHVDVGMGDPLIEPAEKLTTPALLDFADIQPSVVPCYPMTQQIAEKVHAYTRPYATSESTRVKDWVDILLMAELGKIHGPTLLQALHATFNARGTHPLPMHLPKPSSGWSTTFRRLSREVGLGYHTLADASDAMTRFLDPVLQGEASGVWDPRAWKWQ